MNIWTSRTLLKALITFTLIKSDLIFFENIKYQKKRIFIVKVFQINQISNHLKTNKYIYKLRNLI